MSAAEGGGGSGTGIILLPEPPVTTAAVQTATSWIRAAGRTLDDLSDEARTHGRPADFEGDASETSGAAVTAYADDVDIAFTAIGKTAIALERYGDRLGELLISRDQLNQRAISLNNEVRSLSGEDGESAEISADLQARITQWYQDAQTWRDQMRSAEDIAIAALQAVDTVAEAETIAATTPAVDTDSLARQLAERRGDPSRVHDWWDSLSLAEQEALKLTHPELLGSSDGIPAADRDDANRTVLDRDLAEYDDTDPDQLTDEQRGVLDRAQAAQDALDRAEDVVDPHTGLPLPAQLLLFDPHAADGDGYAAVAYGDPDLADHTVVNVPGMMNDGSTIDGNAADALALQQEAGRHGSVSSISWMGYDSPDVNGDGMGSGLSGYLDVGGVGFEDKAEAGGHQLADFVSGLRETWTGDPTDPGRPDQTHMTVIGHSYGSTTVAHSLADGLRDDVDDAVLIGSPGAGGGVDKATDLMPDGHLYVGSRDRDFVTWLGHSPGEYSAPPIGFGLDHQIQGLLDRAGLGEDPAQADFGATRFDVGDGEKLPTNPKDAFTDVGLTNHTTYYQGGSLHNMANIVNGQGLAAGEVIPGRDQNGLDLAHQEYIDPAKDAITRDIAEKVNDVVGDVHDGLSDAVEGLGRGIAGPLGTVESFAGVFR